MHRSLKRLCVLLGCLFPNPCTFHARSFYEEKFTTPCSPLGSIAQCVLPTCDLCYAIGHNSESCAWYVGLKAEIKNTIETSFNSMEHMMGGMFNQFLELGQKQN